MRPGTCRNFTGCWHNDTCGAGVNYRELVGGPNFGWVARLPCNSLNGSQVVCSKREEPTKAEVEAFDKEIEEHTRQFELTLPLIGDMKKRHKKDGGWESAIEVAECPVCKGKLHMSISDYNGHVWGKCETKDCLAWME